MPQLNDSILNIAPERLALLDYATRLYLPPANIPLGDSGYRVLKKSRYTLIADAGVIGPDYQPGHAHADSLQIILDIDDQPLLVDTGTSTYESSPRRQIERITSAHNTVQIGGFEQSEMWAAFRVARRSCPRILVDTPEHLSVNLERIPGTDSTHTRNIKMTESEIFITDSVSSSTGVQSRAFFHFFPGTELIMEGDTVRTSPAHFMFTGADRLEISRYDLAQGYDRTVQAPLLIAWFSGRLETRIQLGNYET